MSRRKTVVVAPDSFKGCLTAVQAASAMARGLEGHLPSRLILQRPMSDGGDGSLEALLASRSLREERTRLVDPWGRDTDARWAYAPRGAWAYVESAQACGLSLADPARPEPLGASTFGIGQLLRSIMDRGLKKVRLGLGGSATVDGGAGALRALGARLLDAEGRELEGSAESLTRVHRIDPSRLDPRLLELDLELLADVDNPLAGSEGAAPCYGPQKGLSPEQIARMDEALGRWGELLETSFLQSVTALPGAGAAGGLGAGLAACGGKLLPGARVFAGLIGLDRDLEGAELALTGEGRADAQTLRGKAPLEVARLASAAGVPVALLAGSLGPGAEELAKHGVDMLVKLGDDPAQLDPRRCEEQLAQAAGRVIGEGRE